MAKKKNTRKYAAVALGIVGVAGLSLASAAQLNVTTDQIAVGSDTFAACDTDAANDGINVSYTPGDLDTSVDPVTLAVDQISLEDVSANCSDLEYTLTILNGSDAEIATFGPTSLGTTDGSTPVTIDTTAADLDANEIYGVVLVIG